MKLSLYGNKTRYRHQEETDAVIDAYIDSLQPYSTRTVSKTIVIKAARQIFGKTEFLKAQIKKFALKKSNSSIAYITIENNMIDKVLQELFIELAGAVKYINRTKKQIILKNGSVIMLFSSMKQETLRGYTVKNLLVIDEAAFISDEIYLTYIMAWTLVYKPLIIMCSTPLFKSGFFYNSSKQGEEQEFINIPLHKRDVIYFDWIEQNPDIFIKNKEFLDTIRLMPDMSSKTFNTEYLGMWMDKDSNVFGNYYSVIKDYNIDAAFQEAKELYFGIDLANGSGGDYTVVTAFDESCKLCFLWRNNVMTQPRQIDLITEIYHNNKSRIKSFVLEVNNLGATYSSFLLQNKVIVNKFYTSNKKKKSMVDILVKLIEDNKIILPNEKSIILELNNFGSVVTENNNIKYGAKNGFNDDVIMSMMLALSKWSLFNKIKILRK